MKLLRLKLRNFRQFYGDQKEIRFSREEHGITVIHAVNGAGKTALLNAFTWVLYGKFTRGFQLEDQLVNHRAIREADAGAVVDANVELEFEHGGFRHIVSRRAEVVKREDGAQSEVRDYPPKLTLIGSDGRATSRDDVADVIGRVLPTDLHSYFFFDGERIERIVSPGPQERKDLAAATKKLLGVEVLDRAARHLDAAAGELEQELEGVGDEEVRRALAKKTDETKKVEEAEKRLEELAKNIDELRYTKRSIENRLRQLAGARAMQERRDRITDDKKSRLESIAKNRKELAGAVSSSGYSVFVSNSVTQFRSFIEGLRKRGELPVGIKRQFVDDLLSRQTCVCARPLDSSSPDACAAVAEWRNRAGLDAMEERSIRMGGEIAKVEQLVPAFWGRVDEIQARNEQDLAEVARIERELDQIREQLSKNPLEDVRDLEARLGTTEAKIAEMNREQGVCETRAKLAKDEIAVCDKVIQDHQAQVGKQRVAQERVKTARESERVVRDMLALFDRRLRIALKRRVRDVFHRISVTPYEPDLTDDYELTLLDSVRGRPVPVASSQGESQVLSLSFIAAVVAEAREWQVREDRLPGPDSSKYPIVMDSPFGALDQTNRRHVSEHLSAIADQIVILVTPTQWKGEVEETLRGKIGATYLLTYFTPRSDVEYERVVLDGTEHALVRTSTNEYEHTEIMEVHSAG